MRLTATTIRTLALPAGKSDYIFFDEDLPGFGLRVRATGGRTWMVQYAIGGRTRRMALGSPDVLDPGKARETAKTLLAQVRLGRDPASEKGAERAKAGETFGALIKPFMVRQRGRLKPRSLIETGRHLVKLCKPLHPLPIAALNRRTIAARLTAIAQANGPAAANRVRGSLGAFCSWAIREGHLEANPVAHTNKATENGPRERLLTDTELTTIWQALADDQYGAVIKLLVLTGLRRSEIGDLCWSEIDFAANLITLAASRTKTSRVHLVPMSAPVRALLEAQPRRDGRNRVFGRIGWHVSKVALDARIAEIRGEPLEPWVVHDLRRVLSTALHDKYNTAPHIVETLLGHLGHQSNIAGVYNKADYRAECTRALDRWADHVMALTTGETVAARVVQLRA